MRTRSQGSSSSAESLAVPPVPTPRRRVNPPVRALASKFDAPNVPPQGVPIQSLGGPHVLPQGVPIQSLGGSNVLTQGVLVQSLGQAIQTLCKHSSSRPRRLYQKKSFCLFFS